VHIPAPAQGRAGAISSPGNMMSFAELKFVNSDYTPKGILKPDAPPGELYDLSSDLSQATNLYRQHPGRVTDMTALLDKIKKDPRSRP
jgi:hypothetical protein